MHKLVKAKYVTCNQVVAATTLELLETLDATLSQIQKLQQLANEAVIATLKPVTVQCCQRARPWLMRLSRLGICGLLAPTKTTCAHLSPFWTLLFEVASPGAPSPKWLDLLVLAKRSYVTS